MTGRIGRCSRRVGRFRLSRADKASAALETAIVLPIFLFLMLGILQFALLMFWQEMLDYATRDAARQMQVGVAQVSDSTGNDFVEDNLCPTLKAFMNCNNIQVQVNASSNYYGDSDYSVPANGKNIDAGGFSYCTGKSGQQLLMHSVYMAPFFLGNFLPVGYRFNGRSVFPIVSTAAFVDEFFSSGAGNC